MNTVPYRPRAARRRARDLDSVRRGDHKLPPLVSIGNPTSVLWAVAVAVASWMWPPLADAQSGLAPGLNWVRLPGAEACLSAAELSARIEGRLNRVLFVAPSEATLFLDGTVAKTLGGYTVHLQVSDRAGTVHGERSLELAGEDCRRIDEAVALVAAVTLYPSSSLVSAGIELDPELSAQLAAMFGQEPQVPDLALAEPVPAAIAADDPKPTAAAEPTAVSATTSPTSGAAPEYRLAPFVAVGAALGSLPALAATGTLGITAFVSADFALELSAPLALPQTVALAGGSVGLSRLQATLLACPATLLVADAQVCLGASVGRLSVRPSGYPDGQRNQDDLLLDAVVAAVYRPRLVGPLRLRVAVLAEVPLLPHAYDVQGTDGLAQTAFRSGTVAARAELGLGLSF